MIYDLDHRVIVHRSALADIGENRTGVFKWYIDIERPWADCVVDIANMRVPLCSNDIWPVEGRYVLTEARLPLASLEVVEMCRRRRHGIQRR